jgi:hypothetical protein
VLLAGCARNDNLGYDPGADALAQLGAAMTEARANRKLILVTAGGDWCSACHALHDFLADQHDTRARLEAAFVQVHVYIGEDNFNQDFFAQARLPRTEYVPHFWILDEDGLLLAEQDPSELEFEDSDDYDPRRFAEFIDRWRRDPARPSPAIES